MSRIFPPVKDSFVVHGGKSLSLQLMSENGIVCSNQNGFFTLLPLGLRAVDKLCKIIDASMKSVGAQKINLPHLTSSHLWKRSGRLESSGAEVMKITDRNGQEYILSPTHEEAVTSLIASVKHVSPGQLPIRLYQI